MANGTGSCEWSPYTAGVEWSPVTATAKRQPAASLSPSPASAACTVEMTSLMVKQGRMLTLSVHYQTLATVFLPAAQAVHMRQQRWADVEWER